MSDEEIPTHIFLIPYRNRKAHLEEWIKHMIPYLNDQIGNTYKVYIIHQLDNIKLFNRGALINIGFLILKNKYPNNYKDIKLIVHDVDIYCVEPNIIKYDTKKGVVRHPYCDLRPHLGGILGGICIIYGSDYEKCGGMPNYFGWGGEDVCMARRCRANNIEIDESNFIHRRTNKAIIDHESNISAEQLRINNITDKLNLKKAFTENNLKPRNTYNIIDYKIESVDTLNNNIEQYNVIFNII